MAKQQRMSKREIRDERRFRAEEARLKERQRRARLNVLVIGGAVVLGAVLLLLVALSINRRGGDSTPASTPSTVVATGTTTAPTSPGTTAPTTPRTTATATTTAK